MFRGLINSFKNSKFSTSVSLFNNNINNNNSRSFVHISQQLRKVHLMADKEKVFKFAGIQLLCGDNKEENVQNAIKHIDEAAKNGAKLISLPECFNSPYSTATFEKYSESEDGETVKKLSEAAKRNQIFLIGGSIPEIDKSTGKIYNTCFIFNDKGEMIKKHRKIHLFDIDVPNKIRFKESETLTPGDSFSVVDIGYCKVGVAICYDIRFPELAMLYSKMGAKFLVYPGAFNMVTGPAHWELLQRGRAVDNQVFVAAISPARNPSSTYQAWGHSTIVNPWGTILATTDEHQSIIYSDIDLNTLNETRSSIPIYSQKRNDLYKLDSINPINSI
ncbi:hypothetical protein ACTFIV_009242 [Dictyostelium citrinum]